MNCKLSPLTLADYDEVLALWRATEGVGLNESDSRENIAAYLARNPGLSFVARDESGRIVGAVLCGHEGRRGYINHLAVASAHRGQGIGKRLVEACFTGLKKAGITRCNIFVFADNADGQEFWRHNGWKARADLRVMQKQV